MGNQQDSELQTKSIKRVENWNVLQNKACSNIQISGLFYDDYPKSKKQYLSFYADEERIYYLDGNQIKFLPLFLTKMEQKFYYSKGIRIYGLSLIHEQKITILSTSNRQNFVSFYCHLAKYCILGNFSRHFEVKQQIGQGSYGTVFKGINRLSTQEVALKVFYKSKFSQNNYCKKVVQNEIYVLQKLKKVNLSPLLEVFQTNDCLILVVQMAKNGDLLNYLVQDETIVNYQFIKHIFQKILQNIQALHNAGFIHRDIKPQNVVFRKKTQGQISLFLCDFSISVNLQDQYFDQIKAMQAGSKGFVAPQVLQDNIYNQKCDIFSFGCLVFFLLSGKKLFEGNTNEQILILTQDNKFIHRQVQNLNAPKNLKKLLKRLLQVNADKRLNATEALNEQYFSDKQDQKPFLVQNDETIKQFIQKRIYRYEQTTRGSTFF